MLSDLGKVLGTIGIFLTSSGVIGESRLKSIEDSLRRRIAFLLSRQGYQDTIKKGLAFARVKSVPITKFFYSAWVIFGYLTKFVSGLLTIGTLAILIFPALRQVFLDWFEINFANTFRVLVWLGICLLGIVVFELALLMFMGWATFKPFWEFGYLSAKHSQKEQNGTESSINSLSHYFTTMMRALEKIEHMPKNESIRYLLSKFQPLRITARIIILPLLIIFGVCASLWLVFYYPLFFISNTIIITLFHFSLSLWHILTIAISIIAYALAFILLFPYSLLDRISERLNLSSTMTVLGIILSIIGIWLQ